MTTPSRPEHDPFQAPEYPRAPSIGPSPGGGRGLSGLAKAGIIVAILASLGLGALGGFGLYLVVQAASVPDVGDCLRITNIGKDDDSYTLLPCRDSKAVFRVEKKAPVPACAGGDYTRFRIFDHKRDHRTLCLVLNVSSGECLSSIEDQTKIEKTACASPRAEVSVSVHDGGSDQRGCGSTDDIRFHYAGPPARTVCLRRVGENI